MSSTFDETFDYLALLGLDPAALEVQPSGEIREQINRRKKEWTAQAINPLYQQQARAHLERARQFERIIDSPEALQAYLGFHSAAAIERRQVQEQTVGEFLALAAGGGRKEITPEQYSLLLKTCEDRAIPPDVLEAALRARRLTVSDAETTVAATGAPYRQPALDRALMTQIAGHLRLLDKDSFYELLDLPTTATPGKVISTARILYDRWSKTLPKTSVCVAWEKSLQACLTYLKDAESKTRYDNAVYNRRLDEFMTRVDLLLAAGSFKREDFVLLATIGVHEFGLSNEVVNQSLRWRAASKGLSLSKPVEVNVSTSGLVKCDRCRRYVEAKDHRCRHCGATFDVHCRNPACGRPLPVGARSCSQCGLKVARGVQYRELLRLARVLVNAGEVTSALDACRLAEQILPSPQIDELVARGGKVRTLAASIRRAAAGRRWSRVERELADLLTLAPQFSQPGCPRLEEVARFLAQLRSAATQLPADAEPESEARVLLELLEKWSDGEEVFSRLRRLAETLENTGRNGPALEIAQRLAEIEPLSEEWQVRIVRLQHKLKEKQERTDRVKRAHDQLRQALAADRLYAAERSLTELEELDAGQLAADIKGSLHDRLVQVRNESEAIRRAAASGTSADDLIVRHLDLIERCRDCRESLAAIQSLAPASPAPPREVAVSVAGTRRVISWQRGIGDPPATGFVVQRSVQRAGARQPEAGWNTVCDTHDLNFVDDEVLHAGTIVRYSVHSLRRGTLSVAGNVLQEFAVPSAPVFAEPVLLWQDVLGLRARPHGNEAELTWHVPAGARQVLVEHWEGTRDERPEQPELLAVDPGGRLIVECSADDQAISYRVACVYDGPAGDFVTPGAVVTLLAGGEMRIESNGSPASAPSQTPDMAEAVPIPPPEAASSQRGDTGNPLKRMGLWPPVPRTG